MRIALHEDAVLVGAGLGLVAVDDEVAREHARRAEAPLDAGGEAGAAAPEQAGRLDLLDDLAGRLAQRGAEALVAAGGEVALEGVPVVEPEAGGDDRLGVGDASSGASLLQRRGSSPSHAGLRCRPSGSTGPAARSAGMRWRMRARVPWGGIVVVEPAGAQVVDEAVEVVRRHLVEVAVVDLEARRLGAGGLALVALDGEQPVVGRARRP